MDVRCNVKMKKLPYVAVEQVKLVMGYTDSEKRCKNCGSFASMTENGRESLPARCEANLFWFEVDEVGYCGHWWDPKDCDRDGKGDHRKDG
jgi:hypothetical protein